MSSHSPNRRIVYLCIAALLLGVAAPCAPAGTFVEDYAASPFAQLSSDYFARFNLNPDAVPSSEETRIEGSWRLVLAEDAGEVTMIMAAHLCDFLRTRMGADLPVARRDNDALLGESRELILKANGGGDASVAASFTVTVQSDRVLIQGRDMDGLRDGVVKLVDLMGFREAPILALGTQVYRPRQPLRVGFKPALGAMRDVVFGGYNGVTTGMTDLYVLSTSASIPELAALQKLAYREKVLAERQDAHRLGLRTYTYVHTMTKFREDDGIFKAHPEIKGVRTWQADGLFTLCTEAPLVQLYLKETVQGLFREDPDLDGLLLIVGGEGFYHCFMRPFGVPPGETTCERCRALGADTVVANLCNLLTSAARGINPEAEIVVWPYSASSVWSSDKTQSGFLQKLRAGVSLLTEVEKDEVLSKPEGVQKLLWDYSIDMTSPGARAREQIALGHSLGVPVYLKSEPELAFEASGLRQVPCMDRWAARADAMAGSGASGSWVFPAYLPLLGTSTAEAYKFFWWDPVPEREALLQQFASRLAGKTAGPGLREAWRRVSEAIEFSPELPPYYNGPHYFGPGHPMMANPAAQMPREFYGSYGYYAEVNPGLVAQQRPIFATIPTGNTVVFPHFYRQMEDRLKRAVEALAAADPLVDSPHRLTFDAEAVMVRWFYHTARTEANFYESFRCRVAMDEALQRQEKGPTLTIEARQAASGQMVRWYAVLKDELDNATAALPIMESDMRLDFRYTGFCPGPQMIRAKIELLQREIDEYLPSLEKRLGP